MKKTLYTLIAILGIVNYTTAQLPNYVPTNGLSSYWPFSGNANDQSFNAKNGIVQNAVLTTDRFGNSNSAYYFNGTNSYIQVPDNNDSILDLTQNFTISAWASIDQLIGNGPTMLSKHIGNFDNMGSYEFIFGYQTQTSQYKLVFFATPKYDNSAYSSFNSFSSNNWVNYICTYDYLSQNCIYYVNGTPVDTVNINYDINNTTIDFLIGCVFLNNTSNYSYYFKGKLDDIGIWKRALTQTEVTALYTSSVCDTITKQPNNQTVNINTNASFMIATKDSLATYQWQTDLGMGFQNISSAGQYNGATNDTLVVSNTSINNNNQNFRCIVSSGSCKDTSSTVKLTVNNNTGINTTSTVNTLKVYPNPASTILHIDLEKPGYYTAKLSSVAGQSIISPTTGIVDISALSNGVYILTIYDSNNQLISTNKVAIVK